LHENINTIKNIAKIRLQAIKEICVEVNIDKTEYVTKSEPATRS